MPTYIYACMEREHPRKEVIHKMAENPVISCEVCGMEMYRVIQRPASIAFNAEQVLTEWMDENYRRYRTKRERFSPDQCKRPGKPIPGTQSNRGGKKK